MITSHDKQLTALTVPLKRIDTLSISASQSLSVVTEGETPSVSPSWSEGGIPLLTRTGDNLDAAIRCFYDTLEAGAEAVVGTAKDAPITGMNYFYSTLEAGAEAMTASMVPSSHCADAAVEKHSEDPHETTASSCCGSQKANVEEKQSNSSSPAPSAIELVAAGSVGIIYTQKANVEEKQSNRSSPAPLAMKLVAAGSVDTICTEDASKHDQNQKKQPQAIESEKCQSSHRWKKWRGYLEKTEKQNGELMAVTTAVEARKKVETVEASGGGCDDQDDCCSDSAFTSDSNTNLKSTEKQQEEPMVVTAAAEVWGEVEVIDSSGDGGGYHNGCCFGSAFTPDDNDGELQVRLRRRRSLQQPAAPEDVISRAILLNAEVETKRAELELKKIRLAGLRLDEEILEMQSVISDSFDDSDDGSSCEEESGEEDDSVLIDVALAMK